MDLFKKPWKISIGSINPQKVQQENKTRISFGILKSTHSNDFDFPQGSMARVAGMGACSAALVWDSRVP